MRTTRLSRRRREVVMCSAGILALLWALSLAGCGGEADDTAASDTGVGPDAFTFLPPDAGVDTQTVADVVGGGDVTASQDSGGANDLGPATGAPVGVELKTGKTAMLLGERMDLVVTVVRSNGGKGPPSTDDDMTISIDGVTQAGAGVAPMGTKQPAVAAWTYGGKLQLVGVRPGTAKVVVTVAGKASPALSVAVSWPTQPVVRCAVADASGSTQAARKADLPDTVQLYGKTAAAGGLTATLRFPGSAKAGDRLDLSKPPAKGGLTISLSFADLGGAAAKPAEGTLWIDQTAKGLFRGTFLGRTTQLKPAVGVFVVERKGMFGIDLLDEPTQVASSDNPLPNTGEHYSRVSLTTVGGGKAELFARRISDGLKAQLVRWQIDAKTGKITPATPLVANANAYVGTPDQKAPAFGQVVRASHPTVSVELWEGRIGKGATMPHRLHVRLLDSKGAVIGKPVEVSDDACSGACQPVAVVLPSTRFLLMWSAPGGGVKIRRVKGQPVNGEVDFFDAKPQVLSVNGKDGVVAVHQHNVMAGWFDPDQGPVWRQFTNKATGVLTALAPAQALKVSSTKAPRQAMLAVTTPSGAPNLLFATAWIDYKPGGKLSMRRIGLDGTAFGLPTAIADVDADALWGRNGKDGQVVLMQRSPKGALVLRKVRYDSFQAVAKPLGSPITALPSASYPVEPALIYVSDADVWVLAWAGDETSPGIQIRRFR